MVAVFYAIYNVIESHSFFNLSQKLDFFYFDFSTKMMCPLVDTVIINT